MKRMVFLLICLVLFWPVNGHGDEIEVWRIISEDGATLTEVCVVPEEGDEYISADNQHYVIVGVAEGQSIAAHQGSIQLPSLDWMNPEAVWPVLALSKRIAIYCTHSDESYEPSDGYYTTTGRGSIYQIAQALASELSLKGVEANVDDTLHHPHDAGAYRRSRQTAVALLKSKLPDCLIDVHRDGIPDPASYAVSIGGEDVSKIRLLVGRGNQNAAVNKEFAITIKAVADAVYPGLIKDIYMGKGTFNQDLLPKSILFECGTYTLEKEKVLASMEMMADVLNRALYGGIVGSAGNVVSDIRNAPKASTEGNTIGDADLTTDDAAASVSGFGFLAILLVIGILGVAILSAGSVRGGMRKAGRNLNEMTGGLLGRKPDPSEDPEHS